MKTGFRQSMAWLHTWVGLVAGWVLYFVFVTGAGAYFVAEIGYWTKPERPMISERPSAPVAVGLAHAQAMLQREAPEAARWSIYIPGWRGQAEWVTTRPNPEGGRPITEKIDPATGRLLGSKTDPPIRDTKGGFTFFELHYKLHYLPWDSGTFIVGIAGMLMLLAILTGVVTHKKIFKDFFTFRPRKGQRSWLDAHNIISVLALPFFLMITYSGLVLFMHYYMPAGLHAAYDGEQEWDRTAGGYFKPGSPNPVDPRTNARLDPARASWPTGEPARDDAAAAPLVDLRKPLRDAEEAWGEGQVAKIDVQQPGLSSARVIVARRSDAALHESERLVFDGVTGLLVGGMETPRSATWKTQDVLVDLHRARFAQPLLRMVFFVSSLLGCAMIATGLILWTVKRRQKQKADKADFGFRLVEVLNIGTIAGLPAGAAAFFWANRLLPFDMANRRDWEIHAIFITWGLMLLYASLRPAGKAWVASFWLAAAAFGLLPVVNALTTQRHLGVSLPAGEWMLVGFDLTMLALGACFAVIAVKVRRKWTAPAVSRRKGKVQAEALA